MDLTHINKNGNVNMVDINDKKVTNRKAIAIGEVHCYPETINAIENNTIKKGDVYTTARIAGNMAVKRTADLIPLCHNILIESIKIDIFSDIEKGIIIVTSEVGTQSKTGVEMEALTAVSTVCLTIYDMCKSIDKNMVISNIRLIHKSGGRSQVGKILSINISEKKGTVKKATVKKAVKKSVKKKNCLILKMFAMFFAKN